MSDFGSQFKTLSEGVEHAAKSVYNMIDQWSFKMLVNNLKSTDYDAATTAIEQLVREKRPLSVPPLYFVSQAHPNPRVRERAAKALHDLGKDAEVEELTRGKSIEDATKELIHRYGNYKG